MAAWVLPRDPLCPVMDEAYFASLKIALADPAWPNTAPIRAEAIKAVQASADRFAAARIAVHRRHQIPEVPALSGRYRRVA